MMMWLAGQPRVDRPTHHL